MKNITALLLSSLFIFVFSNSLSAQTQAEYMKKKNGTMKITFPNSKNISQKGEVKNHLKTGQWTTYDGGGNIIVTTNYVDGILDGPYEEFDRTGKTKVKGQYTKGIKTGEWETFDNGSRTALHHYDAKGNQIGVQETYAFGARTYSVIDSTGKRVDYKYFPNGTKSSVETYLNGQLEGLQYYYVKKNGAAEDSLPHLIENYKNGKREGAARTYKGKVLVKEEYFKDGKREGMNRTWNSLGQLNDSTNYVNDEQSGDDYSYNRKTGKLSAVTHYENGKKSGQEIHYYPNGKPQAIYWWRTGTQMDSSNTFNAKNGKYETRVVYDPMKKENKYYEYDTLGRLTRYYEMDSYRYEKNPIYCYYPNGNLKSYQTTNDAISADSVKVWSPQKVKVLEFTCSRINSGNVLTVHADNGSLLTKGTAAFNKQVEKYMPIGYTYDEESGYISSMGIGVETQEGEEGETFDIAPPPPTVEKSQEQDPIFSFAEVMPSFPGGENAFQNYLAENLKYPQQEQDAGKEGTVYVSFVVEKDGSITNVKVLKSVAGAPGFDPEAIRVISQMPKWNPAQMNGRNIRIAITQPVRFRLK